MQDDQKSPGPRANPFDKMAGENWGKVDVSAPRSPEEQAAHAVGAAKVEAVWARAEYEQEYQAWRAYVRMRLLDMCYGMIFGIFATLSIQWILKWSNVS